MALVRFNRESPCPICGKPDWCLVTTDKGVAICEGCCYERQPQSDAESPLPPPSDPRRAVIAGVLIDLYRQGHCVTTGSMLKQ